MNVEKVREYAAAGMTRRQIAEQMGMSYSMITTVINKHHIECKRKQTVQPQRGPSDQTVVILELRLQGKSYNEIAALTGIKRYAIVHACISWGEGGFAPGKENKVVSIDEVRANVEKCGFEYIGGFKNAKSIITVRCSACGKTFDRLYHIFRDKVNGTWQFGNECPLCRQDLLNRKKQERIAQKEHDAHERDRLRSERQSRTVNDDLTKRLAIHVCKNCGKAFCQMVTGYNSSQYCSESCQVRWNGRRQRDKRLKRMASGDHDSDITLEKLYERDAGICYLCGKRCNWSDGEERNGTFVAGITYPSIDHVFPLSKGGKHTWDNVKLACRGCNSKKSSRLPTPISS